LTDRAKIAGCQAASEGEDARYRLLVEAVTDYALFMLDPGGRIVNWNAGAERIKGYTAEEVTGEHFSKFYTEEDRAAGEPAKALEAATREGRFEKEGWRVRKNGERFWASVVIDAIRGDDGRLIGFAKITRDFTERRNTQLALQAAQEQLLQSQKMEAIGQLTGGIAHDFNNLLTAVLGSLELLKKRMPPEPGLLRLLDNAIQGAERGASLTQRMLAFARRQDLNTAPVDVVVLVHGMADLLRRSLGQQVHIDTRFPVGMRRALADANQLELVLLNLAINARDAMPEGGTVTITGRDCELRPGDASGLEPGAYVCLSVTDTGLGMDEDTLSRAVEPFFTTKGQGKGTGLGLSLVHGVMEQLGGRLILRSTRGEGTTAELWLRAAPVTAHPETRAARHAPPVAPPTPILRVIAVDDDRLVLMNTVEMLRDLGHTVHEVGSGREAIEILRRVPVDLVITDQAMPQMTGEQLAKAVQAEWPSVKVILATGYSDLRSAAAGDLPRLSKPFTQAALARTIAEVTSRLK
jgi:PAS domain S-box-containing protein